MRLHHQTEQPSSSTINRPSSTKTEQPSSPSTTKQQPIKEVHFPQHHLVLCQLKPAVLSSSSQPTTRPWTQQRTLILYLCSLSSSRPARAHQICHRHQIFHQHQPSGSSSPTAAIVCCRPTKSAIASIHVQAPLRHVEQSKSPLPPLQFDDISTVPATTATTVTHYQRIEYYIIKQQSSSNNKFSSTKSITVRIRKWSHSVVISLFKYQIINWGFSRFIL